MPVQHSPTPTRRKKAATSTKSADAGSQIQTIQTPPPRSSQVAAAMRDSAVSGENGHECPSSAVHDRENAAITTQLDPQHSTARGMDGSACKMIGKLDDSVYEKWERNSGSISRSSSDTSADSEGAICKGGPGKACGEAVVDLGVQCDRCHSWYHSACQGISKLALRALDRHKVLAWLCTHCKDEMKRNRKQQVTLASLADKVDSLGESLRNHLADVQNSIKEKQATLEKQLIELKAQDEKNILILDQSLKENETLKRTYADMVKGSCDEVLRKVSNQISELPKTDMAGTNRTAAHDLAAALDDHMDREKRKSNLVVHNLPEQASDSQAERAAQDAELFRSMIRDEMKLNVKVMKSFRVGKKVDGKARLLIITLEEASTKHDILKQAPQLRHSKKYVNIYVTPDLTRKERETNKKLRDELHRRKGTGETNIAIRRGKIITLNSVAKAERKQSQRGAAQGPLASELAVASVGAVSDHSAGPGSTEVAVASAGAGSDHSNGIGAAETAIAAPGAVGDHSAGPVAAELAVAPVGTASDHSAQTAQIHDHSAQTAQVHGESRTGVTAQVVRSGAGELAVAPAGAVRDCSAQSAQSFNGGRTPMGTDAGNRQPAQLDNLAKGAGHATAPAQAPGHESQRSIFAED